MTLDLEEIACIANIHIPSQLTLSEKKDLPLVSFFVIIINSH